MGDSGLINRPGHNLQEGKINLLNHEMKEKKKPRPNPLGVLLNIARVVKGTFDL